MFLSCIHLLFANLYLYTHKLSVNCSHADALEYLQTEKMLHVFLYYCIIVTCTSYIIFVSVWFGLLVKI